MSGSEDNSVYRRALVNLLLPPGAGLLVVVVLMGFLYWLSLGIFAEKLPVNYLLLLDNLRYFSGLVALTLIVTVAVIILIGLRTLDAFTEPLRRVRKLGAAGNSSGIVTRGRLWLYAQLRKRVIVLTVGAMGAAFLLLAGLYLLVLNHLFEASGFDLQLIRQVLGVLRYYGTLVFFGLVFTGFFIIFVSLRQLRRVSGVEAADVKDLSEVHMKDISLDQLDAELEKILFALDDSDTDKGKDVGL